jgi:hypothetical protein
MDGGLRRMDQSIAACPELVEVEIPPVGAGLQGSSIFRYPCYRLSPDSKKETK